MTPLWQAIMTFWVLLYLAFCVATLIIWMRTPITRVPTRAQRSAYFIYKHGEYFAYMLCGSVLGGLIVFFVVWVSKNVWGF